MDITLRLGARACRRLLLAAALMAGGCSGGKAVGPSNQPEVSNNTDTFQWQASNVSGVTQTFRYQWSNSGATANVNQSSTLSGGSAVLDIADAAGNGVYHANLVSNGTFQTFAGTPGVWYVSVTVSNATGTMNFQLQKP